MDFFCSIGGAVGGFWFGRCTVLFRFLESWKSNLSIRPWREGGGGGGGEGGPDTQVIDIESHSWITVTERGLAKNVRRKPYSVSSTFFWKQIMWSWRTLYLVTSHLRPRCCAWISSRAQNASSCPQTRTSVPFDGLCLLHPRLLDRVQRGLEEVLDPLAFLGNACGQRAQGIRLAFQYHVHVSSDKNKQQDRESRSRTSKKWA